MCALDMRPFNVVAGKGFLHVVQTVLNVGVASSRGMKARELVCEPITVSRNVASRSKQFRIVLKELITAHLATRGKVSCTTDVWTDDINSVSFMTVTVHFIDANFLLNDRTLCCLPFPGPHTGLAVLEFFTFQLGRFGITNPTDATVVTDSAANNWSADSLPS